MRCHICRESEATQGSRGWAFCEPCAKQAQEALAVDREPTVKTWLEALNRLQGKHDAARLAALLHQ